MGFLSTTFTKVAWTFLIAFAIINILGLYYNVRVPNMSVYYGPSKLNSHNLSERLNYDYLPLNFNYHKNYTRNKFTVVMPTYNRSNQLLIVIGHYCNISNVHKILVLWNNVGQPVPGQIKDFKCQVPVKIKTMTENNLTSRFRLYPEIETEAIFAVDDDRMVDPLGMEKSFAAWKTFPHLLVGHCPRSHSFQNGRYSYSDHGVTSYSMILTNSVFIHRLYLEMFTETLPRTLYTFIDKNMNGEDILMNVMVADYLKVLDRQQCSCLLVKSSTHEIHIKPRQPGLSNHKDHIKERSECLNLIASVYKYMPLMPCNISIA